jgi:hypothetical protein
VHEAWSRTLASLIGGLTDVGFSDDDSLLLALTHAGRGVFDTRTGHRVARDRLDDWSYFDEETGSAEGIGPLGGQRIAVAGMMSRRQLPLLSHSSWSIRVSDGQVNLDNPSGLTQTFIEQEEIRVCGFGSTGSVWVLATSSRINFFRLGP